MYPIGSPGFHPARSLMAGCVAPSTVLGVEPRLRPIPNAVADIAPAFSNSRLVILYCISLSSFSVEKPQTHEVVLRHPEFDQIKPRLLTKMYTIYILCLSRNKLSIAVVANWGGAAAPSRSAKR